MDEINGNDVTDNRLAHVAIGAAISGACCLKLFMMYRSLDKRYRKLTKEHKELLEENTTLLTHVLDTGIAKIEYRDGSPGILFLE